MSQIQRLARWVGSESAVLLYSLSAAVTAWGAFGLRATPHQVAAISLIGTALVTGITAFATRPVSIPVVTGALTAIATASGAFGLHLSAAQIGAAMPVLSIVLALVLRQAITPVAALRKPAVHP